MPTMSNIPNKQDKQLVVKRNVPKADKYIPMEIVRQLYDIIDDNRDKFYIMWHIETGIRVSDLVGQKKRNRKDRELGQEEKNIDWDNNRIWTYDHKKNKWRWVYFPQKVRAILKIWLKERQNREIKYRQLFPYSEKTCNRIIKKWCKKLNFKYSDDVASHWCRHTFIRLSRKAGRDIKLVQQNTGDTVQTILEWYSTLSSEDMRKGLEEKPLVNLT